MIKKIVKCNKKPEILAITPLSPGDRISIDTKKSVKRNRTPFVWISYMGKNNPYKNVDIAYKQYRRENGVVPKYVIKIDNDIKVSKHWLDKMYKALESGKPEIAYSYTSFEFTGAINIKFPLRKFDPDYLLKMNYISSCSLVKTQLLDQIGGFVTDDKYFRLLDWALWLKFLRFGFIGQPVENAHFCAYASPTSVSCRSAEDYKEKALAIKEDFINPVINKNNP